MYKFLKFLAEWICPNCHTKNKGSEKDKIRYCEGCHTKFVRIGK